MSEREVEEIPENPLVSSEELELRPLYYSFYTHLHSVDENEPFGPNALSDSSFDRMRHERTVMGFLVGQLAVSGKVHQVLQEARLREGRTVSEEELPVTIIRSLVRVRPSGEWDTAQSRETRKQLIAQGLDNNVEHPLIKEAVTLAKMLQYAGHEIYAHDAIAATSKWLERVNKKKQELVKLQRGDPAA